jgi:PPK2 family polyphosphate:nucleotide phosphotransferase
MTIEPVPSPYLVPFDGSFRIDRARTEPPDDGPKKKQNLEALGEQIAKMKLLQRKLYANRSASLLLIFQAMDAAGKDGTIREVLSGVNPAGVQVYSFKAPSAEELDHDFLWRSMKALPERGKIGVFNRSHYEEVLVVRVNPHFLDGQRLPWRPATLDELWTERFDSIRDAEQHWARNGTTILKFFLNVSKDEQKKRFLERIDDTDDNWKFEAGDLVVRRQWAIYMKAYQDAMNETSRPWAPWYAIPADSKSHLRRTVAEIVAGALERIAPTFPEVSAAEREELATLRAQLERE